MHATTDARTKRLLDLVVMLLDAREVVLPASNPDVSKRRSLAMAA